MRQELTPRGCRSLPTFCNVGDIAYPPRRNGSMPAVQVQSPPAIMATRSTSLTLMLGIRPTARNMPGCAGAYSQTIWDCSICWGTCMNGVRTDGILPNHQRREYVMIQ